MCNDFRLVFNDRDNVDLQKVAAVMEFVEKAAGEYANTITLTFNNDNTVTVMIDDFDDEYVAFLINDLNEQAREQINNLARWVYHMRNDRD